MEELTRLFSTVGFMPHGHCYLWRAPLVWTHVLSDSLIGIAYLGIAFTLYALIRKVKIPFSTVVLSFGVFIGACGATHFMEVWTLWYPDYWFSGAIKAITALASVATGVWLFRLRKPILTVAEAAKLSEQRRLDLEVLTGNFERALVERTQALRKSEEEFRALFELSGTGMIEIEAGTRRFMRVNRKFCEIAGRSEQELLAISVEDITHADDRQADIEHIRVAMEGKSEEWISEKRYVRKDGSVVWVLVTGRVIRDENGTPVRMVANIQDITERKRADEIIRASEKKFRELAEAISPIAYVSGSDGTTTYLNGRWREYTGSTNEPIKVEGFSFVHPEDRERAQAQWRLALDEGTVFESEYRLRRHDGVYRWHLGKAVPIRDEAGKVVKWVGTATDIEELKSAVRARDEFLSIASHELKTPLTSLQLQTQLRRRYLQKGDQNFFGQEGITKMIDFDERQVARLARLVDDMLDISRITSGKLTMNLEQVDLCELLKEVTERLLPQLKDAGCSVSVECREGVSGQCDRFRIEQVLTNLIINASKYGAGKPIEIRLRSTDQKAVFEVQDHGVGISQADQRRIFERFERAVSATSVSGLGLGLYITKEIVAAHKGMIRVESQPGSGSTFSVELPLTT